MADVSRFQVVAGAAGYISVDGPVLDAVGGSYRAVLHRREPRLVEAALLTGPGTPE